MPNFMETGTRKKFTAGVSENKESVDDAQNDAVEETDELDNDREEHIDSRPERTRKNRGYRTMSAEDGQDTERVFTLVDTADVAGQFARSWDPSMDTKVYIGETKMLLQYLYRLERLHRMSMPIKACGVDPILFENLKYIENFEEQKFFEIPATENGEEQSPGYELIEVDGDLYLSCVSECLNPEYLNRVLAEATASIKARGEYVFELVGLRHMALGSEDKEGALLNTLRLNTYELSVLETYMKGFPDIKVSYRNIAGKQCICFRIP